MVGRDSDRITRHSAYGTWATRNTGKGYLLDGN